MKPMTAPFPWFGGKRRVASLVWERFGSVPNYVEPFAGSLAVLLGRPHAPKIETVNDIDGYIANFWRAVGQDCDEVARWADWPVNECDLHARHIWLLEQREDLSEGLMGNPEWYDAKIAGWWVWGISAWLGAGWCSGKGAWTSVDGRFVRSTGMGVRRRLPHLGNSGMGVHRRLPHLGGNGSGMGVHRQLPHLGSGMGVHRLMRELSSRLRRVRVSCGDWARICGPSVTHVHGVTGVFLDPPYSADTGRDMDVYGANDSGTVAHDVAAWCRDNGDNPKMRIALCGYEGEHDLPGWDCVAWKADGGYANRSKKHDNPNARRERIWFSPHCLSGAQATLF